MKVMKFGGGCLQDARRFFKVVDILCKETNTVVVVSAIYGITDQLIRGMELAKKSEDNIPKIIQSIREIHMGIIQDTIIEQTTKLQIINDLEKKIRKLERLLLGVAYTEDIIDTIRPLILSYGERLAAIILAGVLVDKGILSEAIDANTIGIITDDLLDNAIANIPKVKKNLKKNLLPKIARGCTPIITGFFGCTETGKITSFGRNGSDYSAAVIACGLEAESLIIWKEVEGFMSADPHVVNNAKKIEQLSFFEAAELSYFGVKILHPRSLEPLLNTKTKIFIKNIERPEDLGTAIIANNEKSSKSIKSVTYNNDIAILRIEGPSVGYKPGIIGSIGTKLSEIGVNIHSIITSQTSINLLIHPNDSKKSYERIQCLRGENIQKVTIQNDAALIAIVGEGMLNNKGLAAKVFTAVAEREINVEMISAGASPIAYYFIIKKQDSKATVNAIHNILFLEH